MTSTDPDRIDAAAEGAAERQGLRRDLGLPEAIAVGVGGTVGGGIFVLVGVAAAVAGPAALVSFIIAFVAALVIALPYAELSCRLPLAGGGYAYARQVLGPHWGFLMGWGYWGAYILISGYVTLGFGGYLETVTGVSTTVGAVGLVASVTLLNLAGVKISGRAQTAVVGVAILGLLVFVVWGAPTVEMGLLRPFAPAGSTGVFAAALVAFLAFGGFDMIAAAGEEVRDPERNLPRAALVTLASVLGLYLLVTFISLASIPAETLGRSSAPLAEAAGTFGGETGRRLIVFVALLTTAATANAVLVVTSRIAFAMARDDLLPTGLRRISTSRGVPWSALLVNGALLGAVAGFGSVRLATAAGGFLYVLHFLPPLVALVTLRRGQSVPRAAFTTPLPELVLPLAFAAIAALLVSASIIGWAVGTAWLLFGFLLHLIHHRPWETPT